MPRSIRPRDNAVSHCDSLQHVDFSRRDLIENTRFRPAIEALNQPHDSITARRNRLIKEPDFYARETAFTFRGSDNYAKSRGIRFNCRVKVDSRFRIGDNRGGL